MVEALESLQNLNAEQLRELIPELIAKIAQQSQQHAVAIAAKDSDILYRQAKIDKFTHELATLKRWKFVTEPLDMRSGIDSALARVVKVFGVAHPHTAYLFANRRANRMKVLVHDGIGFWLAARRLHLGHPLTVVWTAWPSKMAGGQGLTGFSCAKSADVSAHHPAIT